MQTIEDIKNLPDKIYLQVVGDGEIEEGDDFNNLRSTGEISWNDTKIFENDVCYVLQDREKALEIAVKFHKQVAEEAIQEQARLLLENEKLKESNNQLSKALSLEHQIQQNISEFLKSKP